MAVQIYATDKQIEAVAYQLSERFFKLVGNSRSSEDVDDLADEISQAIHKFLSEDNRRAVPPVPLR